MSLERGMHLVDHALNLAVKDLEKRGMPEDEAHIALLIRLRGVVSPEVVSVAEILNDDNELAMAINGTSGLDKRQESNF